MDSITTFDDIDNTVDCIDEINDTEIMPLNTDDLEIHVEKLDNTVNNLDDSSVASSMTGSKSNSSVYKKMTLPLLKTYVIEKGLISDPSKMRKQDLITLIETNNI